MVEMPRVEQSRADAFRPDVRHPELDYIGLLEGARRQLSTESIGNCERHPLRTGESVDQEVTVDGKQRSYSVHTPAGWDGKSKLPVLYYFNGMRSDATLEPESFTGLSAEADRQGFMVVYMRGDPQNMQTYNNGQRFFQNGNDENAYLNAVHGALQRQVPLDEHRQGLAGFSEGGSEAYALANQNRWIASAQSVEGYTTGYEPNPNHPVSEQSIHAMRDRVVPYNGTAQIVGQGNREAQQDMDALRLGADGFIDIPLLYHAAMAHLQQNGNNIQSQSETASTYVRADGITAPPQTTSENGNTIRTWRGANGTMVRQVTLAQGGHGWAGSSDHSGDIPVIGIPNEDFHASRNIGDFLMCSRLVGG